MVSCELCGKIVQLDYALGPKRKPRFCSHSCSSIARLRKYHTKETLETDIQQLILKFGSYMTASEIQHDLSIGSAVLTKHGVSIQNINAKCGFYAHSKMKGSSVFERRIGEILSKYFPDVEHHVKYPDCLSPRGFQLEFDFRVGNILVEADGNQHKEKSLLFDPYLLQCDEIKNNWCAQKGIVLVRIEYRYKLTEKYVLVHLIESLANHNVAGNSNRDGSKNCQNMDNQQPILSNVLQWVDRKVQRLMGEDAQTNNPDTSARRFVEAMI